MMRCSLFIQIVFGHKVILVYRLRNLNGSEGGEVEPRGKKYIIWEVSHCRGARVARGGI